MFASCPEGDSYLAEQFAAYPFHVCRLHRYLGDPPGMASVTLQSLSGGICQGDRLSLSFVARSGAQAHVTTQASTIVHAMERETADQSTSLVAGAGSLLEYLPRPMILFPRARLTSRTDVTVHPEASVLLSESFLLHDPRGADERFEWLLSDLAVRSPDGGMQARDRFRIIGSDFQAAPILGRDRSLAQGSFYAFTRARPADVLQAVLREALDALPGLYAGASELPSGCGAWARILAGDATSLSEAVTACWRAARSLLTGRALRRGAGDLEAVG